MPKTVRFHELGGPEKLKIEETSARLPGNGEVKLNVKAIGLNRAEALYLRGDYLEQAPLPSGIGYEASGIVEAVGANVDRTLVGKNAATVPGFSMAKYPVLGEEAIVPAKVITDYPPSLSYVQAASVWMQYLTAYGTLVHFGRVSDGDFVVIPAASSSVGLAAIQVVRAQGATAIAVTRTSAKCDQLLQLGAHHVIASEEEDLVQRIQQITAGKGACVVFDPVGGPMAEKLAEAAAPQAIIFEYGGLSMQPTTFPLLNALRKGLIMRGYTVHEITRDPVLFAEAKQYVYERLADGRFDPKIAKVFPFEKTVEAYRYLESNAQVGKIVISLEG
jgi:NADPH:quinone reductase-like Zn-dependent oxidoreductase